MLALWDSFDATRTMNTGFKTAGASLAAGGFRVFLMPIDAVKTIMQVEGKNGLSILGQKMRAHGPLVLYHGALGGKLTKCAWCSSTPPTQLSCCSRSSCIGDCCWPFSVVLHVQLFAKDDSALRRPEADEACARRLHRLCVVGGVRHVVEQSACGEDNKADVCHADFVPRRRASRGREGRLGRSVWQRPEDAHHRQRSARRVVFGFVALGQRVDEMNEKANRAQQATTTREFHLQ